MGRVLGRSILLIVLSLTSWSTALAVESATACQPGKEPTFLFGFASLQTRLGSSMGDPTECERVEPVSGDVFQRTTTGIALYRRDTNTPMFTNGREHWALTSDGVAHWTGWHGSAAPLEVAAPRIFDEAQAPVAGVGAYTSVEAVTIVDVLDDNNVRLVVRRDETTFDVKTDGGCAPQRAVPGGVAFVVSPDTFAGPASRLILALGEGDCLIVEASPR